MGTFSWPIEVGDRDGRRFERLEALADTGASYTVVPAEVLRRLGIEPGETVEFEVADGRSVERTSGEARVRIDGRTATTVVVFGGPRDPVLLGAHALEGTRMAVDPVRKRLVPTRALLMSARDAFQ